LDGITDSMDMNFINIYYAGISVYLYVLYIGLMFME